MKQCHTSKRYNDDFRKMIVGLYYSGHSVRSLSSNYGVSKVSIYAWIDKFSQMGLEYGSSVTSNEYSQLQKETLRLQEENDIFKKVLTILVK